MSSKQRRKKALNAKKKQKRADDKAQKRAIEKQQRAYELEKRSSDLLKTIADWKLEAKLEDNDRYFFHTSDVDLLENGSRCYVIGRKGTGKTAISEHLHNKISHDRFSQKLTFKNFPFNDLYRLENASFRPPNQYITLWKYLIYSSIAKLMLQNENISSEVRVKLAKIYSDDPITSLPRTISKWTSREFEISILGTGVTAARSHSIIDNDKAWIERVEILEKVLEQNLDDSAYLIIFDELDEDYKDITQADKNEQYTALLTSLFKAVQDIKSIFPMRDYKILPIVFLRDDIYDNMRDPDKTKWSDLAIALDWSTYKIKALLAFRLSRAMDPNGPIMNFDNAWDQAFSTSKFVSGGRKIAVFDFITRSTLIRPRDYVRYLKAASEITLTRGANRISPSSVRKANSAFSNYLRSELEDEIHSVLPEVKQLLDMIAHMRTEIFSFESFSDAYLKEVTRGFLENRSAELVLKILFHFSVLGNLSRNKEIRVFRYLNKEARFNSSDPICVHRGLFKSLQIF
jgi:Cdc6-like AAA superfamily ATPase